MGQAAGTVFLEQKMCPGVIALVVGVVHPVVAGDRLGEWITEPPDSAHVI